MKGRRAGLIEKSHRDRGTGRGFIASRSRACSIVAAAAQSVPAARLTPSATEDFTPRDLLRADRRSPPLSSYSFAGASSEAHKQRGLGKDKAKELHTNLASRQEQEDLATPFLY